MNTNFCFLFFPKVVRARQGFYLFSLGFDLTTLSNRAVLERLFLKKVSYFHLAAHTDCSQKSQGWGAVRFPKGRSHALTVAEYF